MTDQRWRDDPNLAAEAGAERVKHRRRANGRSPPWRELEIIKFANMRPRLAGRPLIKGLLDHEQISLIVGNPGSGKTFFALDRDLHIAAGFDWFGRKVTRGGVIYLAAEAGRSIENRVVAWRRENGLEHVEIPFAAITSPVDLCHTEAGDIELLVETIRRVGFSPLVLLEIDTLNRAMAGGNENSPEDMGGYMNGVDRLRDQLRCHVSNIHHFGKDASRGSRGHNSLICAVDTEIQVTRDETTKISTAAVTKQRDGIIGSKFNFHLRQVELGRDQDGDPVTTCVIERDEDQRLEKKRKTPTGSAAVAFKQLQNCVAKNVTVLPASDHVPKGATGVRLELWRNYLLNSAVLNKNGNPREEFRRIRMTLQRLEYIGVSNDYVWIVT
jgi:RecA-family ATPase